MARRVLLEVCVDTPAGLAAAIAGGADRIELCAALDVGGLTPPAGLIAAAARTPVPVRAMIRPRGGGFVYTAGEVAAMRADIAAVRAAGLAGVVIGAATAADMLDIDLLRLLAADAAGLGITLHRVVDLLADADAAVDAAVDLGIDTILTSGGAPDALGGIARIAAMQARAGGRVTILAGAGVTAANAAAIVAGAGVRALHASCRTPAPAPADRLVALGFAPPAPRETDADAVARLAAALDRLEIQP
ncbi:MAG: copper homeostasis protein CutC [Sphingomonas fennica]